jgi:phosphopantothenoylcysteine decarboxylase/phosphopantothenate--cysteine ligase
VTVLIGERILLGVTGGIAAYKSAELVRRLKQAGADVRVVMTQSAEQFMTVTTMQALSGNPVRTSLWDESAEAAMSHIELARWATKLVVAPASADFMARLTGGLGNDLLSTLCLATKAPVYLAPAMNHVMWANSATVENTARLVARGFHLLGPGSGEQACGEVGEGRMLEPDEIVQALDDGIKVMAGHTILITAGPTFEDIDPVRFIGNRSSGKMGYALAEEAAILGAKVLLVSGPVSLPTPFGVQRIDVRSALQMHEAVMTHVPNCTVFIAAAAVADYRPVQKSCQKIKKTLSSFNLELERTADILADVAARSDRPACVVGFAAETERVEEYAMAKLNKKNLDIIAANDVSNSSIGFESENNALTVFTRTQRLDIGQGSKRQVAHDLLEIIQEHFKGKQAHA